MCSERIKPMVDCAEHGVPGYQAVWGRLGTRPRRARKPMPITAAEKITYRGEEYSGTDVDFQVPGVPVLYAKVVPEVPISASTIELPLSAVVMVSDSPTIEISHSVIWPLLLVETSKIVATLSVLLRVFTPSEKLKVVGVSEA